ncbi:hypothetical protein [Variovorax sp. GT1P44]
MNYRNLTLLCVLTTLVVLAGCEPKPQAPKATAISSQAALA